MTLKESTPQARYQRVCSFRPIHFLAILHPELRKLRESSRHSFCASSHTAAVTLCQESPNFTSTRTFPCPFSTTHHPSPLYRTAIMLASSGLRPARAFAIRFQPAVIASCSAPAAPFSTSAPTRPTNKTPRTARPAVFTPRTTPSQITIRNESSASGAAAAQQAPSSTAATGSEKLLTWNDFLALRRTRRKINVVASGFTAVGVTYAGLQAFISGGYDSTLAASFGLDPLMVTGLSTIGMLGAGWLIGPFFGGAIFSMRYRTIGADIQRVSSDVDVVDLWGLWANISVERTRILQPHQATPCRSYVELDGEPGPGLLWREDWECCRLSEVVEGPAGFQSQEGRVSGWQVRIGCCTGV
jgi:import inner membrane translocase subunit TIM23